MQQAGLGAALGAPQKQGQDLSGMMAMMHMLKDVPDQTLADVLAGKPVHLDINGTPTPVPQFAAMLAAQGRQELRTAMAGQQPPQQSIKDQLLSAEQQAANPQRMIVPPQQGIGQPQAAPQQTAQIQPEAGLDQLPAPNIQNMAEGGIIAFDVGGTPEDRRKAAYAAINEGMPETAPSDLNMSISDYYNLRNKALKAVDKNIPLPMSDTSKQAYQAVYGRTPTPAPAPAPTASSTTTPPAAVPKPETPPVNTKSSTAPAEGGIADILKAKQVAGPAAPKADAGPKIMTLEDTQEMIQADPMYQSINNTISELKDKHSRFQAMLDEYAKAEPERKKEIEDRKSQGIGEYMMNMGAALVSNPQFGKAIQEGNTAGLAALNLSRKEAKELQKDYRDYTFSMQKAAEAAEQGNQELAQRYQANGIQLQNTIGENMAKANQINISAYKAPAEISELKARANYYNEMPGVMAAKGAGANAKINQITVQQAITDFDKASKDPKQKREFLAMGITTPLQYQQAINSGTFGQPQLLDSLPKGANTLQLKPQ